MAIYQRLQRKNGKKKRFALHIFRLSEDGVEKQQTLILSKRCKSLEFDGKDIILVHKSRSGRYFFTRLSERTKRIFDQDADEVR